MLQIRVGNPVWEAPQIAVRRRPPERQLLTALRSHLCYSPTCMSNLRVGLAGYGGWAREAYVPAIQRAGSADIVAAAAVSSATRDRIRIELGAEVRVYEGFAALLKDPDLDAVFIALPDSQHEAAISAAIESGQPFFYEPPVAESLDRIRPMLGRLLATPQITQADMGIEIYPRRKSGGSASRRRGDREAKDGEYSNARFLEARAPCPDQPDALVGGLVRRRFGSGTGKICTKSAGPGRPGNAGPDAGVYPGSAGLRRHLGDLRCQHCQRMQ